jgi:hypothetical protein
MGTLRKMGKPHKERPMRSTTETPTLDNTFAFTFRAARRKQADRKYGSLKAATLSEARDLLRADTRLAGQTVIRLKPARSWMVAALVRGEDGPSYNSMRYAKWEDADNAGSSLLWRWSLMTSYVVEPSEDEPNA